MSTREGSSDSLIKTDVAQASDAVPTNKMIVSCIAAYFIPGAGHILLGRWQRGLIFSATMLSMFSLGLLMKGHLFYPSPDDWLLVFHTFADIGIGLPYFICLILHKLVGWELGFGPPQAIAATFEYGNTFLWTAGLLNYLVILDAYDIAIGRKR